MSSLLSLRCLRSTISPRKIVVVLIVTVKYILTLEFSVIFASFSLVSTRHWRNTTESMRQYYRVIYAHNIREQQYNLLKFKMKIQIRNVILLLLSYIMCSCTRFVLFVVACLIECVCLCARFALLFIFFVMSIFLFLSVLSSLGITKYHFPKLFFAVL